MSTSPSPTATPLALPSGNVVVGVNQQVNVSAGTTKFSLDLGGSSSSSPLVDTQGNSYFVAGTQLLSYDANGRARGNALDLTQGASSAVVVTAPAAMQVVNGATLIYVGDNLGRVHIIDVSNPNAPTHRFPPNNIDIGGNIEYAAPALDCQGNVYYHTRERNLVKINVSTGATTDLLTSIPIDSGTISNGNSQDVYNRSRYASPVYDATNNRVMTGSQRGFHVVNLDSSGNKIDAQTFTPGIACTASGCGSNTTTQLTSLNKASNSLLAIDKVSGTTHAYVISEAGTLFKLNVDAIASGDTANAMSWATPKFAGEADSAPVVGTDGTVYIASETGILTAYDRNGTRKFEVGLGGAVEFASPVIGRGNNGEDVIYIGTENGYAYGFTGTFTNGAPLVAGAQRLAKDLQAPVRSNLSMGPDGTVYVGSNDGRMTTIFGDSTGISTTAQWARAQGNAVGTGRVGSCP